MRVHEHARFRSKLAARTYVKAGPMLLSAYMLKPRCIRPECEKIGVKSVQLAL